MDKNEFSFDSLPLFLDLEGLDYNYEEENCFIQKNGENDFTLDITGISSFYKIFILTLFSITFCFVIYFFYNTIKESPFYLFIFLFLSYLCFVIIFILTFKNKIRIYKQQENNIEYLFFTFINYKYIGCCLCSTRKFNIQKIIHVCLKSSSGLDFTTKNRSFEVLLNLRKEKIPTYLFSLNNLSNERRKKVGTIITLIRKIISKDFNKLNIILDKKN